MGNSGTMGQKGQDFIRILSPVSGECIPRHGIANPDIRVFIRLRSLAAAGKYIRASAIIAYLTGANHYTSIMLMSSARLDAFVLKLPRIALVTVTLFCFCTPRIIMQK